MKFRTWINIITIVLLALAIYLGRHQITQAWGLMGHVNITLYLLIIPIQLMSYYAVGEVMFSYLRSKGDLMNFTKWRMARVALELNFVNHIIPVPTFAGFSYLGWILGRDDGVSAGRATMAQIIRYVMMFASFMALILMSVIFLSLDKGVDRLLISISVAMSFATIFSAFVLIYFLSSKTRMMQAAKYVTLFANAITKFVTFGRKQNVLNTDKVKKFFDDMYLDYVEIQRDYKILLKPLMWAVIANVLDMCLIAVAFLALGYWVNPATLFVALGISSFVAIFAATPGGSGVYEAIMIAFLVSAGVPAEVAIAGTLLARVTLFAGTIGFGFIFYQLTISKYGKIEKPTNL